MLLLNQSIRAKHPVVHLQLHGEFSANSEQKFSTIFYHIIRGRKGKSETGTVRWVKNKKIIGTCQNFGILPSISN